MVSGNETPTPSFPAHLQGIATAREAWLKARSEERLKRSLRARNRPLAHVTPGSEVDICRRCRGKGTRPHIKGRFHVGAVVLATSAEIQIEDGSRKPRKVTWIIHAGMLLKCAPEHLRYSSERARRLAAMGHRQKLPWTHEGLHVWLRKRHYDNMAKVMPPGDNGENDERDDLDNTSSAVWDQETRQVKIQLDLKQNIGTSSSLAAPPDEASMSQATETYQPQQEQRVPKTSKPPQNPQNKHHVPSP